MNMMRRVPTGTVATRPTTNRPGVSRRAMLRGSAMAAASAATWSVGCAGDVKPVQRGDIPTVNPNGDTFQVVNLAATNTTYPAFATAQWGVTAQARTAGEGVDAVESLLSGLQVVAGQNLFNMHVVGQVLASAFGLQVLQNNSASGLIAHPQGTDVFGGMTLVAQQLVTATAYLNGWVADAGQLNFLDAQNLDVQNIVNLDSATNPTGTVSLPGRNQILTLMSGTTSDPKAALALVSQSGRVDRVIEIPGTVVAQLSPSIVVDSTESYAVIGTSDGTGRLFKIDLNTGSVSEHSTLPGGEFHFHSGLALYDDVLFVASHHEGGVYMVDPHTMDALGFLPVGRYIGPITATADGVVAPTEGAFQLIRWT